MDIYNYSPKTGEYLSSAEARPDPIDASNHLIPAHATTVQPPVLGDYQAACWNDSAWVMVPDYRGVAWWHAADASEGDPLALGEDLPTDGVLTAPPAGYAASWDGSTWTVDLAAAQKAVYGRLSQDYGAYISGRGYPPAWQNSCREFRRRFEEVVADENATTAQKAAAQTGLDRIAELQVWLMETLARYYGTVSNTIFAPETDLAALEAVTWDFDQFTSSDPNVSIGIELLPLDITARPAA